MPVVPMREILDRAFADRYGVAAINVVDDLSLEAVLAAAADLEAPLIVQTSLKTVKQVGPKVLHAMVKAMADEVSVPVALHLDHCPEREWVTTCLRHGWNSVLFDGSHLDIDENTRPKGGILVESPHEARVTFTANGAEISLGSTIVMRAEPNGNMLITLIDGRVTVTVPGQPVGWEGPIDLPLARWRPGSEQPDGWLPVEVCDPVTLQFVRLPTQE